MRKIVLVMIIATGLMMAGCGSDTKVTEEITEVTEVNISDDEVINVEISDNEVIDVDVNITISAKEAGLYGEGTFENPLLMANANYSLEKGDVWLMTPSLSANCTIRMRTLVAIRTLHIEDAELLPIAPESVAQNVLEFDVNSSYAVMNFYALERGYITLKGACLDTPKLYNY